MDYLEIIRKKLNPPVTREDMNTLLIPPGEAKEGQMLNFTFRGREYSVVCEHNAQETAIRVMLEIGFDMETKDETKYENKFSRMMAGCESWLGTQMPRYCGYLQQWGWGPDDSPPVLLFHLPRAKYDGLCVVFGDSDTEIPKELRDQYPEYSIEVCGFFTDFRATLVEYLY